MEMDPIRIEHDDIKKAIQSGHSYIQVGKRKFLLLEIEEVDDNECYNVTDFNEEKKLMEALYEDNPILSEEEIQKMLEN